MDAEEKLGAPGQATPARAPARAPATPSGGRLHNARTGRSPKSLSFSDRVLTQPSEDHEAAGDEEAEMATTPGSAASCVSWCCQVGSVFPLTGSNQNSPRLTPRSPRSPRSPPPRSPRSPPPRSPRPVTDKEALAHADVLSGPGPSPGSATSAGAEDPGSKPSPKNCYRLIVAGSPRVGKSSLVARFLNNKFPDDHKPTIEEFYRKLYRIRGEVYQMDVLDTSGHDPFPALRRTSYLTGDLFVLVFSLDNRDSYEEVIRLRETILDTHLAAWHAAGPKRPPHPPRVPMVIAGNKADIEPRAVTPAEAKLFATNAECCEFVEVSAARNENVAQLFGILMDLAGLPLEMAPDHHRRLAAPLDGTLTLPSSSSAKKCTLSIKRRLSDACGVVTPNVRRPSLRTDLRIMRDKTSSAGRGLSRGGSAGGQDSHCALQ